MKKILIASYLLLILSTAYAQQISNAGLENWQSQGLFQVPDSFHTFDNALFLGTPTTLPTTDSHSGQYAALIQTIAGPATTDFTGFMSYGSVQVVGLGFNTVGWPFTHRPIKMKVWYKYLPSGNDSALFAVLLTKNSGNPINIGIGSLYVNANTPVYTQAEVPISYFSALNPDTIIVGFVSSASDSITPGTQLYIDDITLEYAVDVKNNTLDDAWNYYPNPFSNNLYIQNKTSELYDIDLTDLSGRNIYSEKSIKGNTTIDGKFLSKGIYFLHRSTDSGTSIVKVIKE